MTAFAQTRILLIVAIAGSAPAQQLGAIPKAEYSYADSTRLNVIPPPEFRLPSEAAGTVSVDELRHPPSRRAVRLLEQAQKNISKGDHAAAIKLLNDALDEGSAALYVHPMLGSEYLKAGNVSASLPHLQKAVELRPTDAGNHSNLGYAFCLAGDCARGEREMQTALALDKGCLQAQYLLGVILLDRGDPQSLDHLRIASNGISIAHLALASYYGQRDETEAAAHELLAYLGPRQAAKLPAAQEWLKTALVRISEAHEARSAASQTPVETAKSTSN